MRKAFSVISIFIFGVALGLFVREIPNVAASIENQSHQLAFEWSMSSQPKSCTVLNRSCYSLEYDHRTRNASWVYECLTSDSLRGETDRANFAFKEDPSIPAIFRSTLEDYRKSGFDRGHLAPAANHKSSSEDMQSTFFLSNMSPQCPQFNRGYWAQLEKHVRDLTKSYETVEVFTGPLYLPKEESDGARWVKYQVIGKNDVAVPTHFFKVLVLKSRGKKDTAAYVLPNEQIAKNTPLDKFKATVEKVEKCAGILFTSQDN